MVERLWFGNDDHPLVIRAVRGVVVAFTAGISAGGTAWLASTDIAVAIITGVVTFSTVAGQQMGFEGLPDYKRHGPKRNGGSAQ